MKFKIAREKILKPLQHLAGVVERRQTLPVLANVLMVLDGDRLSITGTDTEVELVANLTLDQQYPGGQTTIPAKKLLDICKSLPDSGVIDFEQEENRVLIKCGRSKFSLATLPAVEFPSLDDKKTSVQFSIRQGYLKELIDKTSFAMAQQDVRFYLNGMLLEVSQNRLRAVATDGHRLALGNRDILFDSADGLTQAIVPRKGITELARLFNDDDKDVVISLSGNHLRAETEDFRFTSKLIDAKYPDYERVLPKHGDKTIIADKDSLKQCFARVSILSNEKYRGVRLRFESGSLTAAANNPEQEEAEESIAIDYAGANLEIGFNVNYLLDVLSVVKSESVSINLMDTNSSALIKETVDDSTLYVVMPMRL
jgi:DNA polymerase-3 subunit beta